MNNPNFFCFGFGQVAKNFISKVISENVKINLSITTRQETENKKFNNFDYKNFKFIDNTFDDVLIEKIKSADYILISIPPVKGKDIVIENFNKIISESKAKWITYLSATSVYGNHNGEWVNEESETNPTSDNGIARLNAEKKWMDLAVSKNLPLQIFRLSGIYSNHSNVLVRLKAGEAKIVNKDNHFFSRIHVEDIASILFKSLSNFKSKEIYNISDDRPSSSQEIILYGSKLLDIDKPESIEINKIVNKTLRNFYKDSKKVSNKKMKSVFTYKLKYPSYIEGLKYIRNNFI